VSSGSSGSFKKILADDVERIELFIAHGIPDIVKAVFLPFLTLGFLFTVDWRLALISLTPLIFVFIASYFGFVTPKAKAMMKQYHQALEDMNSGIVEFVRAMPVMKIFGQSASEFKKYSHTVNHYDTEIGKWIDNSAKPWGMLMSFLNNALLPVLVGGFLFFFNGSLGLSVFFLFLILGVGYIRMVFALMTIGPQMTMINHGVKRIDEILFEIEEQQHGHASFTDDFSLTFDHVNFS
jgi:ATP-binding cassette subfamily B protein